MDSEGVLDEPNDQKANSTSNSLDANNNAVIYIKDPKNKSAEIQHVSFEIDLINFSLFHIISVA